MALHDELDDVSGGRPRAPGEGLAEDLARAIGRLVEDALLHAPIGGQIDVRVTRRKKDLEISIDERGRRAPTKVRVPLRPHAEPTPPEPAAPDSDVVVVGAPRRSADRRSSDRRSAGPPRRGSMARPLEGVRVLVVDDENDARELASMVLIQAGAVVFEASSATDALRTLQRHRPDVVVSDIGMPGQDGHSLIRMIRDLPPPFGAIRAMAVTAFARTEDRHRSLDAGFDMHVVKPVDPANLVGAVARLVGRDPTEAA